MAKCIPIEELAGPEAKLTFVYTYPRNGNDYTYGDHFTGRAVLKIQRYSNAHTRTLSEMLASLPHFITSDPQVVYAMDDEFFYLNNFWGVK